MELQAVQNRIYEVRGVRVMLDFDLARLYGAETRVLNQAVKRNRERFPDDFMFQLTSDEVNRLIFSVISQNATPGNDHSDLISQSVTSSWGGTRKLPYVFTQEGVAMLSGVLRSPVAIRVNIEVMRAFVALRRLAMASADIRQLALENREIRMLLDEFIEEIEGKFDEVYVALSKLAVQQQVAARKPRKPIGFHAILERDKQDE